MAEGNPKSSGKIAAWALKNVLKSPLTWIGAAVGTFCGVQMAQTGAGGAGFFGLVTGAGTAFLLLVISKIIQGLYHASNTSGADGNHRLIAELEASKLSAEAKMLWKMKADVEAIRERHGGQKDDPDVVHTIELVSEIEKQSYAHAEELQDLVRRVNDPLLGSPKNVDEKISEIREQLMKAYQAVADARSRLRRGEKLGELDFLSDSRELATLDLSALTSQLEEETIISTRVEARMEPDFESRVLPDDRVTDSDGNVEREKE